MDDPSTIILLSSLVLCVVLSAFFSASETAFMASSRIRLKAMQNEGNRRAALALQLTDDYDRLLTTILVGNNLVNIAGTTISAVVFTRYLGNLGPTVSTVVMTVIILLLGEISPKTLAKRSPEKLALSFAPALNLLIHILAPINSLFTLWHRLLDRLQKTEKTSSMIEAELITMVDEAEQEGGMDIHEGDLIRSAIEFVDQDALDIMTPRVDVTAIEDIASMSEAERLFRETGFSRLPVFHEDLDHMVGVLNEKDFYTAQHAGVTDIRRIMVPPVYAPASLKISKLLKLCQSTRTHLIIVLDEYGGTEGIVTIEDVLEELVGEIYDEHDDISEELVALEDGSIQVDGGMQLGELMNHLKLEDTFEADTAGGWASEQLGCIPQIGMSFDIAGYHVVVTGMKKRRVTKLQISHAA